MRTFPISIVIFASGVSEAGLQLWMQKRVEDGPLNGLLEFPGGKIEESEGPLEAATREVIEETNLESIESSSLKLFKIYRHDYQDRSVNLFTHLCLNNRDLSPEGWINLSFDTPLSEIEDKLPEANKQIIKDVCSYINEIRDNGTLEALWGAC